MKMETTLALPGVVLLLAGCGGTIGTTPEEEQVDIVAQAEQAQENGAGTDELEAMFCGRTDDLDTLLCEHLLLCCNDPSTDPDPTDPGPGAGTVLWDLPIAPGYRTRNVSEGPDGTLYVNVEGISSSLIGDIHDKLVAVAPDGTVKWTTERRAGEMFAIGSATLAVHDDSTIVAKDSSWVTAYDANGNQKWNTQVFSGYSGYSSPAIAADGTVYVTGRLEPGTGIPCNKLVALGPDGVPLWQIEGYDLRGDSVQKTTPSVGADGTIYLCEPGHYRATDPRQGRLWAVNPDGTVQWRVVIGYNKCRPAIGADGTLYVATMRASGVASTLHAIAPDGTPKWTRTVSGEYSNYSDVIIGADGTIYTARGRKLVAFDPDGTEKWVADYSLQRFRGILAVAADDSILVIADDGLIAVAPDGSELHRFKAPAGLAKPWSGLHFSMDSNGHLYRLIPSSDSTGSTLVAIDSGTGGLADSSWPLLYGTSQANGRPQ